MPLDLPDRTACFIDANILYYHFVDVPPLSDPGSAFLQRVAAGRLTAYTAVHAMAEAVHKVMVAAAAARFALNRAGLVNWLQHHRDRIKELSEVHSAAVELAAMGMAVLPADTELLVAAAALSRSDALLTNDALILALLRRHQIQHLVTNDDDFDGLPNLTVWKPR